MAARASGAIGAGAATVTVVGSSFRDGPPGLVGATRYGFIARRPWWTAKEGVVVTVTASTPKRTTGVSTTGGSAIFRGRRSGAGDPPLGAPTTRGVSTKGRVAESARPRRREGGASKDLPTAPGARCTPPGGSGTISGPVGATVGRS